MSAMPLSGGSTIGVKPEKPLPVIQQATSQRLVPVPPPPPPPPAPPVKNTLVNIDPASGVGAWQIHGVWVRPLGDGSGQWIQLDIRSDLKTVYLDFLDAKGKKLSETYGRYTYVGTVLTMTFQGVASRFTVTAIQRQYTARTGYYGGYLTLRNDRGFFQYAARTT